VDSATDVELRADIAFDTNWVWGDEPFQLWFKFPSEYARFLSANNGDPFIAALLAPAMFLGEPLILDAAISQKLSLALPQIQAIYRCWDNRFQPVAIRAPVRQPSTFATAAPARVGLFFSMGVDSSYSLCKNIVCRPPADDPITHLILVNGFDVYLWEDRRFPPLMQSMQHLAGELSKAPLVVTTNLREVSDRIVDWVQAYHGAALASIVLALRGAFCKVHIAAGQTFANLVPRGSHPLLDPLWSTEEISFVHDGLEATRQQKITYLGHCPMLVSNLRVCAISEDSEVYNCGECEKCLRTMIGLHIAGLLSHCQALPHEIDPERIRSIRTKNTVVLDTFRQFAKDLGESATDRAIRAAIREVVDGN
jgi:hypothetical protein